jgi:hypothetical protein
MKKATATRLYGPSPISRRSRRSKADIETIKTALYDTLAADYPATVRQVFYRLVSAGIIPKTETAYKTIVCRLLVNMRKDGDLPYAWLADSTRWQRKPQSYPSLQYALEETARLYRRSLWHEQPTYVEVWCEKDALAGVFYEETARWDVPLMVTRGYASLSYLYEAGQAIAEMDKETFIYYLGDYDPSGVDIPQKVEQQLRHFAPDVDLHFERLAVTPEQIAQWTLPTRPTKTSDSRSRGFGHDSVELDAIPPARLRGLVRRAIRHHLDPHAVRQLEVAEASERDALRLLAATWQQPPAGDSRL